MSSSPDFEPWPVSRVSTAPRGAQAADTLAGIPDELLRQARERATAEGYAAGWAEGLQAGRDALGEQERQAAADQRRADAERRAALNQAVSALRAATDRLAEQNVALTEELEHTSLALALHIAEAVVDREIRLGHAAAEAVSRALAHVPEQVPLTVRLHPDDYRTLTAGAPLTDAVPQASGWDVTLAPDPSLEPGDAVAQWQDTTVDARLSRAWERVREVLGDV